jgi:hypothetical protein
LRSPGAKSADAAKKVQLRSGSALRLSRKRAPAFTSALNASVRIHQRLAWRDLEAAGFAYSEKPRALSFVMALTSMAKDKVLE